MEGLENGGLTTIGAGNKREESVLVGSDKRDKQLAEYQGDNKIVLRFLDSLNDYIHLRDSLSYTLRQGWLDIASARHSMGMSRISSTLLDHKSHSASTTLELHQAEGKLCFALRKWALVEDEGGLRDQDNPNEQKEEFSRNQVRYRGCSTHNAGSHPPSLTMATHDQVQKERSRALSMFGALVPPKLRDAQQCFEKALETLVEIVNMHSEISSTSAQIKKALEAR